MAGYDFWTHASGGATRPDARNIDPRFHTALQSFYGAAPEDIRSGLGITSAYRSPERQAQLYADAVDKYGSPEAARKWVAPPGKSNHNRGMAMDLGYGSDAARAWAHENAAKYGLAFPLSNEPWHIELAGIRDGGVMPDHSGHDHGAGLGEGVAEAPAWKRRADSFLQEKLGMPAPDEDRMARANTLMQIGMGLMG